jgi:CBS domain containing-hemolysin-like protein
LVEVTQDAAGLGAAISIVHLASVAVAAGLTVQGVLWFGLPMEMAAMVLAGAGLLLLTFQTLGRAVGGTRPEPVASVLYTSVRAAAAIASPLVKLENLLVTSVLRPILGIRRGTRMSTTEEDLRALVDAVEETEALEREEREMITSIFEMSDRDVREIMVPRVDVVAIDGAKSVAEALDLAVSTGHSRFPVFEEDMDHVLGVVHLRDMAQRMRDGQQGEPVAPLARPVHVIPEGKKIDELLRELQELRTQMALVVDEYGGVAGIVTVEDLLEEIVGEIRDEYDTAEEDAIQIISDREAIMDGRVSIHDANEALPLQLDPEEYETLAGVVYGQLGRVPLAGDVVSIGNCQIRVLSTTGRRVRRLHVAAVNQAEP